MKNIYAFIARWFFVLIIMCFVDFLEKGPMDAAKFTLVLLGTLVSCIIWEFIKHILKL